MTQLSDRRRRSAYAKITDPVGFILLAAILTGSYLRFAGIGDWGFWTDELFHVFAARSYLTDRSFYIPWVPDEYTRAMPVTLLTALSFRFFGESEATARFLFALSNVVFILIAFRILKSLFSRNVAVIFVVAMSISSFAVGMSRETRMYTLFQLFYFLMSVAFFRGLEYKEPAAPKPGAGVLDKMQTRMGISWLLLLLALCAGLLALWLHQLTVSFVFVAFAYALTMFLKQGLCQSFSASLRSRYGTVLILIIATGILLSLASSDFIRSMQHLAFTRPVWYNIDQSNASFYYDVLRESHPFLWAIFPFGLFMAVYRYKKAGVFFGLSFIVLFVLHSFVLVGRTSDRYIFYLLPFFITIGAVGAESLILGVVAIARNPALHLSKWSTRLFYVTICLSLSLLFLLRIEAWHSRIEWFAPRFADWKNLDPALVESVISNHSITTDRLRFNYYFGQYPDYVIDASDVEYDGGERVIVSLQDLLQALDKFPDVYVVAHSKHLFNDEFVGPEIRDYLLDELPRVDSEDDLRIMVFKKQKLTYRHGRPRWTRRLDN